MKSFFLFLVSVFYSSSSFSSGTIGILHGDKTITYTALFDTDVKYIESKTGVILKNKKVYSLDDEVLKKDEDVLELKERVLNNRLSRARKNVTTTREGLKKGFLAESDLDEAEQSLYELIIQEKENRKNIDVLNKKKSHLSLTVPGYFIIRNSFVYCNAYLKAGDDIVTVEFLNTLQVDVKTDPVQLSALKTGSDITWRSLVSNKSGAGKVSYIKQDDDITSGFKKVVVSIPDEWREELINLVDTPFEVIFDDKTH
ncbi:hypothetical protein AAD16_005089 [Salmonella enterica subsp. diarizonae]|nr:hypothetical protein [Salmonella enterica subsp. diarizonae]EDY0793121.1 hypothetical protein [Salmonella enterica subsp. diarizonae]